MVDPVYIIQANACLGSQYDEVHRSAPAGDGIISPSQWIEKCASAMNYVEIIRNMFTVLEPTDRKAMAMDMKRFVEA